jgi:hypothetical protein
MPSVTYLYVDDDHGIVECKGPLDLPFVVNKALPKVEDQNKENITSNKVGDGGNLMQDTITTTIRKMNKEKEAIAGRKKNDKRDGTANHSQGGQDPSIRKDSASVHKENESFASDAGVNAGIKDQEKGKGMTVVTASKKGKSVQSNLPSDDDVGNGLDNNASDEKADETVEHDDNDDTPVSNEDDNDSNDDDEINDNDYGSNGDDDDDSNGTVNDNDSNYRSDEDDDDDDSDNDDSDNDDSDNDDNKKPKKLSKEGIAFEKEKERILSSLPAEVVSDFKQLGFTKWEGRYQCVLQLGPYHVSPGEVREKWMQMYNEVRIIYGNVNRNGSTEMENYLLIHIFASFSNFL